MERPRLSEVETKWYSSQWSAACEPPLEDAARSDGNAQFAFRFSLLPSFDTSLFIRLETRGNGYSLIVKQMTGNGGYDPGIISRSKEIPLSDQEVAVIRETLAKIIMTRDESVATSRIEGPKGTCFGMLDGTMWVLEIVDEGRYDLIHDNSPAKGPLFDLGHMLLAKTGWVDFSGI